MYYLVGEKGSGRTSIKIETLRCFDNEKDLITYLQHSLLLEHWNVARGCFVSEYNLRIYEVSGKVSEPPILITDKYTKYIPNLIDI